MPPRTLVRLLAAALLLAGTGARAATADPSADVRLQQVRGEIARLTGEVTRLGTRESGLLGDLERLGAEIRLRTAEREEVELRREVVTQSLDDGLEHLAALEAAQAGRRGYLSFRLREIYKSGPEQVLRGLIGGGGVDAYWSGLRYASFLSERDGRVLKEFRADTLRIQEANAALEQRRAELDELAAELTEATSRLKSSRQRRERLLGNVRDDKSKRQSALAELRDAAEALSRLATTRATGQSVDVKLDVRKFRGLLDWPAAGALGAGFGTVVHPRFKTRVPHPGVDIDGAFGEPIRAVFDGEVVFSSWMRGYGLTAIVDHGHDVLSIYAHASVLLVEPGQRVIRGQKLGTIGDTGSLRGPYLYFELRVDGSPADPARWLRPR